jgi:hypothetical protein
VLKIFCGAGALINRSVVHGSDHNNRAVGLQHELSVIKCAVSPEWEEVIPDLLRLIDGLSY